MSLNYDAVGWVEGLLQLVPPDLIRLMTFYDANVLSGARSFVIAVRHNCLPVRERMIIGRALDFRAADEAVAWVERASATAVGVVAIQHTVDIDTGEVLVEPVVLNRFGEVPAEFREE